MHLSSLKLCLLFLVLGTLHANVISTTKPNSNVDLQTESPIEKEKTAFDLEDADAEEEKEELRDRASQLRNWLAQELAVNPLKQINNAAVSTTNETQIWFQWAQLLNGIIKQQSVLTFNVFSPFLFELLTDTSELSNKCYSELVKLGMALQQYDLWALKMVDASGRGPPSGALSGTVASLGDFDQCLEIVVYNEEVECGVSTQGQYCLVELALPVPKLAPGERLHIDDTKHLKSLLKMLALQPQTKLNLDDPEFQKSLQKAIISQYSSSFVNGICVPSGCSGMDIELLVKAVLGNFTQVKVDSCTTQDHEKMSSALLLGRLIRWGGRFLVKLDSYQWISLIIFSGCIILVLLATFLDLIVFEVLPRPQKGAMAIFTDAFSVRSNWNRVFSIQKDTQHQTVLDLRFINGLRVCTMFWIVFLHCATLGALPDVSFIYRPLAEALPFYRSLAMQFIYNGQASVDIFFFISGFILVFVILRSTKPTSGCSTLLQLPPLFNYIVKRVARLLIPMVGLLSIHFLWPYLGSGPLFGKYTAHLLDNCRLNGWKNLLLIGNYESLTDICLVPTWFLSADFQLHLIAYPLAMVLAINEQAGLALGGVFILAGVVIPGHLHYLRNAPVNIILEANSTETLADLGKLYFPTYNHLAPYFIGFLLGYLMLKRVALESSKTNSSSMFQKSSALRLTSITVVILAASVASLFGAYAWSREEGALVSSEVLGSLYFALHKVVFILGPAWIVWLCVWYPKNPISHLLSTHLMEILSHLSFSIYLVHLLVIWYFVISTRSGLLRFTFANFLFMFGGVLIFTLPLSFAFYCIFEAPWTVLVKHAMQRERFKGEEVVMRLGTISETCTTKNL